MSAEQRTIGAPCEASCRRASPRPRLDEVEPVLVDEVALGQRDDAARDAEQVEDREVLARLRHHAFVGGDDEQREVDAADAGEHVLDEALVAGHVDDADLLRRSGSVQPGEAEVDGHAAVFLFLQAVGVDAGEGRTSVDLPWSTWPAVPITYTLAL